MFVAIATLTLNGLIGQKAQKQSPGVFCKKGIFKNFVNFTGKQLCWNLFLIKRDCKCRCVTGNIAKFLRTAFL